MKTRHTLALLGCLCLAFSTWAWTPKPVADDPLVRIHQLPLDGFSDLSPFLERGMRRVAAVFARSRGRQLAHTLSDVPEHIDTAQLDAVGRSVLRVVCGSLA